MATTTDEAIKQQSVVVGSPAPLFVHACPGAGKTRVLVDRFIQRTESEKTRGIAVVSFTNRAAEEVSKRATESSRRSLRFPHFVGTFDRFIATYVARPHMPGLVQIVESWQRLGAVVTAKKVKGSFSLDSFHHLADGSLSYRARPNEVTINEEERGRLEYNAGKQMESLHADGYFSCADIRLEASRLLEEEAIVERLATRFAELMVDEAQDCGADELTILSRLLDKGLPIFMVCDPNQAIYEWREASPALLEKFVKPFPKLPLISNWRSSPPICAAAASVRGTDSRDVSVGPNADNAIPFYVLPYSGRISTELGERYLALTTKFGIDSKEIVVLAHGASPAAQVVGAASKEASTTPARLAKAARAAIDYGLSHRQRSYGINQLERILGHFMKIKMEGRSVERASEEEGIDRLAWKFAAARVGARVNAVGWHTTLNDWIPQVRDILVEEAAPFERNTIAPKVFLKVPAGAEAKAAGTLTGLSETLMGARHSTVHDAKGSESEAVLMVLPPDRKPQNRTSALVDKWEGRIDEEAKRVLYVGLTRARALCALAVPGAVKDRVISILARDGVPFEVVGAGSASSV